MKLRYCPECAAPLEQENLSRYKCTNGHFYWNNPRSAVALILIKDGQALFAKRRIEPHKGKYDFPGGFIDYGENAYQALVREIQEETGLAFAIEDATLLHSTTQLYIENVTVCDLIFAVTKWTGEPKADDDVESLEWKPINFIDSTEFAWDYAGLVKKLQPFI